MSALHHVQIAAPPGCEDEARGFFGGLIGLEELEKPGPMARGGGVWFRCGQQSLHVGADPAFEPARKAHPAFAVDGREALQALAEVLVAAGVEVRWDDRYPGYVRFYASDPWGNRLEFLAEA